MWSLSHLSVSLTDALNLNLKINPHKIFIQCISNICVVDCAGNYLSFSPGFCFFKHFMRSSPHMVRWWMHYLAFMIWPLLIVHCHLFLCIKINFRTGPSRSHLEDIYICIYKIVFFITEYVLHVFFKNILHIFEKYM